MSGDRLAFDNAINQGHSAAWDEDWEKAASQYKIAVNEFPDNLTALTSLALALYELQKYQESLEYYQRAARLSVNDPVPYQKIADIHEHTGNLINSARAYMEVAEVYARNKDVEKAILSWCKVVALDPEHLAAHTRLALVYERLGRNSEAMVEFIAIASLLQSQGNVQKALQTIKHALQVVPNSKEAGLALNILQSGKILPKPSQQLKGSGPFITVAETKADTTPIRVDDRPRLDPIQDAKQKALSLLAELLFEQEEAQGPRARKRSTQITSANTAVEQAQSDQASIILHLNQAIDLQSHGQDEQAISGLEQAIRAGLENSAAYYILGFLQSKNEKLEDAVNNLKNATQHEVLGLGARLLLGLTLYRMESVKEASIEYLQALRIADSESVPADQAEELIQLYEPVIDAFSSQSDEKTQKRICENISKMLIRPDWREQIKLARQQIPAQPYGSMAVPLAEMLTEATSSQLVESLAKVNQLARANKLRSAMEEAYFALKFAPSYLPLHICIGDLLLQENRVPEAILKYSMVARTYSIRGEANRAISLFRRVSELAPTDLDARNNLIDMLMARGKIPETMQEFLKLAETYYSLADLAMARKTYSRAFRFAQQANVSREMKVKLLHRMADIDMQSLDWRNAIRVFEQIRTLDPENSKARDQLFDLNLRLDQSKQAMVELDNYLNHLLSVNRAAEAVEFLNAKILENQSLPALFRRLAEVYRLLGRTDEAIVQLERSKEMYIKEGNRSGAIEALVAILALNPANASSYQRMLAELQAQH